MTRKTAFVSGASGFIGVNLVKQLELAGWEVTALHRKSSDLAYLSRFAARRVIGDITDAAALDAAMPAGVDAVFHVAGNVSFDAAGDAAQTSDNIDGTRNMVTTALNKKARRFIQTSSGASWGLWDNIEINEDSLSNVDDIPVNYFRTKKLAEDAALAGLERGLDVVVVNPAYVVGPFDRVIWGPFVQAVAQGKLEKVGTGGAAFCHVEEVARAHIAAFEKGVRGERYLLSGAQASFAQVGETVASLVGGKAPRASSERDPGITPELFNVMSLNQLIDCSKAIRALDFKPVALRTMFGDLCAWMREEGLLDPK
ncbi:MAG: NAD-dependent epimerase/dehydratase family protein [Proteobacteria bacterium]|nr:NAD-dependent epimerase/dehydratase family protein [Pseudomonadota bacterium]MDA1355555.1 NAD-dependent epimerase/dehydratase family protein [Pseudomonadota bacterium]